MCNTTSDRRITSRTSSVFSELLFYRPTSNLKVGNILVKVTVLCINLKKTSITLLYLYMHTLTPTMCSQTSLLLFTVTSLSEKRLFIMK